jgi:hypothetical protein
MTTPSDSPEINRLRRGKSRARLPGQRHFRNAGTLRHDLFQQIDVIGWINPLVAARQYGNGAVRQARPVRRGIDAPRQARDDAETGLAKFARQPLGEFHAGS